MKQRPRIYYTETDKALMWDRYARIIKNKCTDESAQAMWSGSKKTFQPDFRHVVDEIFTGC